MKQMAQATIIFQTIQNSPPLQDILAIATSPSKKAFFIAKLLITCSNAFAGHTEPPLQLFDILTTWFGKHKDASKFDAVATAFNHWKLIHLDHRNLKVDFIHRIGLNWSPATRDSFLKGVKTVYLRKLRTPYPVINEWICKSDAIDNKWHNYLKHDPRAQPDSHRKRQPDFCIEPSNLSLDIRADQSTIVYDANTGDLILIVLQNFCSDPDLLSHIEGIMKQAVDIHKSIRGKQVILINPYLIYSLMLAWGPWQDCPSQLFSWGSP